LVQSESGKLFAQVAETILKTEVTWADIKTISDHFCVQCHLDDGFEKETTWKSLKPSIVTRLKLDAGEKGAMPPSETTLGKKVAQGEKNLILAWIEKQQLECGTLGDSNDPSADNSDVAGDLKVFSDKYCLTCHADFKKNAYWNTHKTDAAVRIQSGNMPRGQTM
jgi:hypothetical protein